MRFFAFALALFALLPAASSQVLPDNSALKGCYAEAYVGGRFMRVGDRDATAGLGAGCTASITSLFVFGGGIRAEFGDANSGAFYLRPGIKVNDHLLVYAPTYWRFDDWKWSSNGQWYVGAGAETTIFSDRLSAFAEITTAVQKVGNASRDDLEFRVGLRHWLPTK
jgi:hypothetical protein